MKQRVMANPRLCSKTTVITNQNNLMRALFNFAYISTPPFIILQIFKVFVHKRMSVFHCNFKPVSNAKNIMAY